MLLKGNHFCLITNKNIGRLYRLSVFLVQSISDIGTCKKIHIGTPLVFTILLSSWILQVWYNCTDVLHQATSACRKETHWWSFYKVFDEVNRDTASLLYYLKCFDNVTQNIQQSRRKFITGDGSSTTIWKRPTYEHHQEDRIACETPLLIEAIQPRTKYIIALRNPTDLVYSGFWYICRKIKTNPRTFHEFVENSLEILYSKLLCSAMFVQ